MEVKLRSELSRGLLRVCESVLHECVEMLSSRYGFDVNEAKELVCLKGVLLDGLNSESKSKSRSKSKSESESKERSKDKSRFPLPYNGEFDEGCCFALRQNSGLYTQCEERRTMGDYCNTCAKKMQKMGAESPEFGTIQQRMSVGIFEYVDPKGRKPVAYTKVMKKHNITEEEVLQEASKWNKTIHREHFTAPAGAKRGRPKSNKTPKEKGPKGRPKKAQLSLEIDDEDEKVSFKDLVRETIDKETSSKDKVKEDKAKKDKAKKEQDKINASVAKELKATEEAKWKAEEAKAKAESEANAEAEANVEANVEVEVEAPEKAKTPPVVVSKFTFEGKPYLRSKHTGIVYDYNQYVNGGNQVVIGKWDKSNKQVIFDETDVSSDEESEEEEEFYDD